MIRSSYLLVYNCTEADGESHEELMEILAYSYEQAYLFALSYCDATNIISLETAVKKCSY